MAIFDRLKSKKETVKKNGKETLAVKAPAEKGKKAVKKTKKETAPQYSDATGSSVFQLVKPRVTEKANLLAQNGQYVFEITPRASKIEIKKAIERLYKVKVASVNVLKTPAKKVRVGRREGLKKTVRKAIVKLKKGEKIEILAV